MIHRWRTIDSPATALVAPALLGSLLLGGLTAGCGSGEREPQEPSLASRTAQVGPEATDRQEATDGAEPVVDSETAERADDPALQWRQRTVERSSGDCGGDPCVRFAATYPELTGGASEEVLERIDRTLMTWLSSPALGGISDRDLPPQPPRWSPDGEPPTDDPLVARAEAFLAESEQFRRDIPAPPSPWWIDLRSAVDHRVGRVVSVRVDSESYTGGAHGLATTVYWLFDLETGEALGLDDLVAEGRRDALRRVVEERFREVRGLAAGEDLEEAGFFVEDGKLPLTGNVAVTADGLTFQYQPYEVAPYAAGPTTVPVPWDRLDGLLSGRLSAPTSPASAASGD